jgi:hypothetical protein
LNISVPGSWWMRRYTKNLQLQVGMFLAFFLFPTPTKFTLKGYSHEMDVLFEGITNSIVCT